MKEAVLRKWHRTAGVIFALFIFLQVLTGIVLSVEDLLGMYWGGIIHEVHYGYAYIGIAYRIILGIGLVWMVVSGWMIYMKIRRRMKQST